MSVVTQLTAKTTNSEKAIYFLSLVLFNKLKSIMLFTCKNIMFSILCGKNFFAQGNGGGRGWGEGVGGSGAPNLPPSLRPCIFYMIGTSAMKDLMGLHVKKTVKHIFRN